MYNQPDKVFYFAESDTCMMNLISQKITACIAVAMLCLFSPCLIAQDSSHYRRFPFNDAYIYALYDSPAKINDALAGAPKKEIQSLIKKSRRNPAVNAFLVLQNDKFILIDTGYGEAGKEFKGGLLMSALSDIVNANDINVILLTHMHPDHTGALMKNGQPQFPNATIYVSEKELAYWNDDKNIADPKYKSVFDLARAFQKAYAVVSVKPNQKILSNVTVIEEYGHTPGHIGYLLDTKPRQVLFWGDIIHHLDIQTKNPNIYLTFDVDSKQAIRTRKRILDWAVENKIIVAGAHLPFPGIITITKGKNNQYQYQQVAPPSIENEGC